MSVNVHIDRVPEFESQGYVVVGADWTGRRVDMEHAGLICLSAMRDGPCRLDKGHRGRCSTVAFYCDGCGKRRRGAPRSANEDVAFCFLCVDVANRLYWTKGVL